MKGNLEKAVKDMAKKAEVTRSSIEAMQYTQAALNAANALRVLKEIERL